MRVPGGRRLLEYEELTEPERAVWNAVETGELIKLSLGVSIDGDPVPDETWGENRQVRAQLLCELLTGCNGPKDIRPRALRLAGARITGTLNLEAVTLVCPLSLRRCSFEHPIVLREAQASAMRLLGCRVPGLDGEQLQIRGNFELKEGFIADGEVNLMGAHISGQLSFEGATLANPRGRALLADGLIVDQAMFCRGGFTAQGEVSLIGARIGHQLSLIGATLTNPQGRALNASKLTVGQSMHCREGFTAQGEVNLGGAHIGGSLEFDGASLTNPQGRALSADGLTVDQSTLCRGLSAQGEVSLIGARIGHQLSLIGATLTNPQGLALCADGLTVDRSMFCSRGFTAQGVVNLAGAHIGGQLSFIGATLINPQGRALLADGLIVDQAILCREGFAAYGEVNLVSAHIGDQLIFEGVTLKNPDGMALVLAHVRTAVLTLLPKEPPEGTVDLRGTQVGTYYDSQATWPYDIRLDGFTYEALIAMPEVDAMTRLRWLKRDPLGYIPQPYEQLAAAYRKAGRNEDARKIAIAKQRRRRQTLNPPGKAWNSLLYWTVGYGYDTWRAGVWMVVLVGLGWRIFDRAHPAHLVAAKAPGQRPSFHAGLYALDLLLPFADLGYQSAWIGNEWARWFCLGWNLAGWILITTVVAALSGLIKRD